jgi:long-subunit fatty acid transport protein
MTPLAFAAFSQEAQGLRFGFTASPGISWMTPDNEQHEKDGSRFAFTYGVLVDYKFGGNERYAIQTGLGITMAGGKLLATSLPDSNDVTYQAKLTPKLQHLEIPIGLKLRSNDVNDLVYYGLFGLTPGFVIRNRAAYEFTDSLGTVASDNIRMKDLKYYPTNVERSVPFNLGLQIEAGIEYSFTENTALVAGIFFNNGFTNVLKDEDDERVVLRRFGIRLGVLF